VNSVVLALTYGILIAFVSIELEPDIVSYEARPLSPLPLTHFFFNAHSRDELQPQTIRKSMEETAGQCMFYV
jgi:hypothetical protein